MPRVTLGVAIAQFDDTITTCPCFPSRLRTRPSSATRLSRRLMKQAAAFDCDTAHTQPKIPPNARANDSYLTALVHKSFAKPCYMNSLASLCGRSASEQLGRVGTCANRFYRPAICPDLHRDHRHRHRQLSPGRKGLDRFGQFGLHGRMVTGLEP